MAGVLSRVAPGLDEVSATLAEVIYLLRVHPDTCFEYVSPSVESMVGYTPQEHYDDPSLGWRLLDPRDVDVLTRAAAAPIGELTQFAVRWIAKDGRTVWTEHRCRSQRRDDGSVVIFGAARDATDQHTAAGDLAGAQARHRLLAEHAEEVTARLALAEAVRQLRAALEAMLDPLVVLEPVRDESGRIVDFIYVDANAAALRHNRATREQLIGAHLRDVLPGHEAAGLVARYAQVLDVGEPMLLQAVPYADEMQDGETRLFDLSAVKAGDRLVLSFRDVTERVRSEQALAASEALFRTIMQSAAIGMAVIDVAGTITLSNPAFCALVQREESWLLTHRIFEVVAPADKQVVKDSAALLAQTEQTSRVAEVRLIRADGSIARTRVTALMLRGIGDDTAKYLVQVEDFTAEWEASEQLAFHAFYDTLTGLRNRAWLIDALDQELEGPRISSKVAVFFVDVDNFKLINESLGHAAGDVLLCAVADRISGVLAPSAQVGRFAGDEFVAVVPDRRDLIEVEQVAARISAAIAAELEVAGHSIVPTASIGIAVARPDDTAASLLRDANTALFRAKAAGRARWHFFDEEMHAQSVTRLTLEAELREGLTRREFVAHYQPLVDLAREFEVVGYEALVRWQHPTRGLLPPGAFLDVAEDSGLIVGIGHQMLEQVCALLAERPDLPGPISVNVSAVQLRSRDWIEDFTGVVQAHGVDPRRLVVEVTETAVLSAVEAANEDLASLRDIGVGVHVDDFGTGFSSISLLRDLPVTGLKLDRSFVNDLTDADSPANALAAGLAGLVSGLNLIGIAEGIETEDQAATLLAQGWQVGQGYFFGKPGPMPGEG